MNHPKIGDAKQVVERRGAVAGVVVLFYQDAADGQSYGLASYGVDKERCSRVARIADQIADTLEAGIIAVPDLGKKGSLDDGQGDPAVHNPGTVE